MTPDNTAPNYSAARSAPARSMGLGRKKAASPAAKTKSSVEKGNKDRGGGACNRAHYQGKEGGF